MLFNAPTNTMEAVQQDKDVVLRAWGQIHDAMIEYHPFTSLSNQVEVFTHEKRHVEDRICEWLGINDIEASAYLAGFLGVKFWEFQQKTTNL